MANLPPTPEQIVEMLSSDRNPRPELSQTFVEPVGETEIAIAEMWSDVLRIKPIGREDNLFVLGGDSLSMTQLAARVYDRYGVELSFQEFFAEPTVRHCTNLVQRAVSE